jgi:hypothetical protein
LLNRLCVIDIGVGVLFLARSPAESFPDGVIVMVGSNRILFFPAGFDFHPSPQHIQKHYFQDHTE